jgi:mono/diheme cytochrome c family protein
VKVFSIAFAAILMFLLPAPRQTSSTNGIRSQATAPTFYKDILPVLQDHCQSCHRAGEVAPMPLETYDQARAFAPAIAHAVEMKMMPPWFADPRYGHFANDSSLSESQVAAILAWVRADAPAGDPHDAPPPHKWTQGWNISHPDLVVTMPRAVKIPANGEVEYTYEIVPTHFAEDRWVQMSEFRPGSAAHVHHAVVYIRPPDSQWLRHAPVGEPFTASTLTDPAEKRQAHETTSDLLLVYAPGSSPDQCLTAWRSSFRQDRISFSRCTTPPTALPMRIGRALAWFFPRLPRSSVSLRCN